MSRTRTLKNGLTANRQTSTASHGGRRLRRTRRSRRRRGVNRARACLRHNHAAGRRSGRLTGQRRTGSTRLRGLIGSGLRWRRRRGLGSRCGSLWRSLSFTDRSNRRSLHGLGGYGSHRLGGRGRLGSLYYRRWRRYNFRGRRGNRSRRPRRFDLRRTRSHGLRSHHARCALWNRWSCRCGRLGRGRLVDNRLRRSWRRRRTGGRGSLSRLRLARQNCLQRIAGLGDLGQIDFRAELFAASGAVTGVRAALLMKVLAYFFGLIGFHGTGVGLFLRDADFDKHVENLFAFYFQLASQIVNSNLHPPFVSLCLCRSTCLERCGCAVARYLCLERSSTSKTSLLRLPGHSPKRPRNWLLQEKLARARPHGHTPTAICCPGSRPARPDA